MMTPAQREQSERAYLITQMMSGLNLEEVLEAQHQENQQFFENELAKAINCISENQTQAEEIIQNLFNQMQERLNPIIEPINNELKNMDNTMENVSAIQQETGEHLQKSQRKLQTLREKKIELQQSLENYTESLKRAGHDYLYSDTFKEIGKATAKYMAGMPPKPEKKPYIP